MNYWNQKFKIKNLEFPRFIGAPLDGVTDSPFRRLVRKFSKEELLYTEMRHVASVANAKNNKSLKFLPIERPLNFQFAANKVDFIPKACEKILREGVDSVDLNIGCPARQTVNSGSGSALMSDVPRLKKILCLFRDKLKDMPFTVKMRAGFKENNALTIAKIIQDAGADAIAIHPRLQSQKFSGIPDYSVARKVKNAVTIPVLFSGGIVDFKTANMVYEQTGVDGFLIGRGMWSKPWKLKELKEHSVGKHFEVDKKTILQCALSHLSHIVDYYGKDGVYIFRKHLSFYIKGIPFACELRHKVISEESIDKVKEYLIDFLG